MIEVPNRPGPVVSVDDEDGFQELIRYRYERSPVTNRLLLLSSGFDFLDFVADVARGSESMPSLVLLDINMPAPNGFEILSSLRGLEGFGELPEVILLTSSASPRDAERALAAGAARCLEKPVRLSSLIFTGGWQESAAV